MKLVSNQRIPPKPAQTADADKTPDQLRAEGEALLRHADALEKWGLKRHEAILALLDAPTRAAFEADAKGDHDELLDLIGIAVYRINVGGTPAQLAELINRGYQGTDDFFRSVEDALAIARGEETEAAKAQREVREVMARRAIVAATVAAIASEESDFPF